MRHSLQWKNEINRGLKRLGCGQVYFNKNLVPFRYNILSYNFRDFWNCYFFIHTYIHVMAKHWFSGWEATIGTYYWIWKLGMVAPWKKMVIKAGWQEACGACHNTWTRSYLTNGVRRTLHAKPLGAPKAWSAHPGRQGGGQERPIGKKSGGGSTTRILFTFAHKVYIHKYNLVLFMF
jgi:hypothetical protein